MIDLPPPIINLAGETEYIDVLSCFIRKINSAMYVIFLCHDQMEVKLTLLINSSTSFLRVLLSFMCLGFTTEAYLV